MKSRNLFLGIIILFVGVVALLASLDVITFSWSVALRLWPMLFIFLGVAILPINNYLKTGLSVLMLGLSCLLYHYEAKNHPESFAFTKIVNNFKSDIWSDDDENDGNVPFVQEFSEPFGAYSHATLNVDFGAGEFEIKKPCAELVKVNSHNDFAKYSMLVERDDECANVYVSEENNGKHKRNKVNNELDIALSDVPLWTVNIETGAADCDFDFSPYKVEKLNIEAGVCDMDIRLGNRGCDTELIVESGVSDINIEIPASMDCKIYVDSAITSKDFKGFEKVEKGVWQASGDGSSEHAIVIKLDCGVSDIDVERY